MSSCPVDLQLQRLLAGELSEVERQTLEVHLIDCAACEERLAQLSEETQAANWRQLLSGSGVMATPPAAGQAAPLHRQMAAMVTEQSGGGALAVESLPVVPGYELLEVIGCGGMGVIYKARQTAADRVVAAQDDPPDPVARLGNPAYAEQLRRFRAEAEAAARLQHPSIVGVHEVGECHGVPYFSLEFVEGGTLAGNLTGNRCRPHRPRCSRRLWPSRCMPRISATLSTATSSRPTSY